MSKVAEQLREAREAQKLSINQVAEITKIRGDHLRALEEGRFGVFAAPVYIRGFVRTYSTLLKLDVPATIAALDAELRQDKRFAEAMPGGAPKGFLDFVMLQLSKLDWKTSLVGLGVIVLLAVGFTTYAVLRHHQSADPLRDLKPGVYQTTKPYSGQTLPLPAPKR